MVIEMQGKNFNEVSERYFSIDLPDRNEGYESAEREELTAEKVFFYGLNKKLPVKEQSTLSKITKVSLVKNSV
jgi:hypothetical protein